MLTHNSNHPQHTQSGQSFAQSFSQLQVGAGLQLGGRASSTGYSECPSMSMFSECNANYDTPGSLDMVGRGSWHQVCLIV